jgi:hypothetical protein
MWQIARRSAALLFDAPCPDMGCFATGEESIVSVSTVAWLSQAAVFSAASTFLRPSTKATSAAPAPRTVVTTAREYARRGCLTVPALAPLLPPPQTWPLPAAADLPLGYLRNTTLAALSHLSLYGAPPAACQNLMLGGLEWGGLQGSCEVQCAVWTHVWAQAWDAASTGFVTGVAVVTCFALMGAAVGTAQCIGDRLQKPGDALMPKVQVAVPAQLA